METSCRVGDATVSVLEFGGLSSMKKGPEGMSARIPDPVSTHAKVHWSIPHLIAQRLIRNLQGRVTWRNQVGVGRSRHG